MLVTCHWSASPPQRLRAYHLEFALTGTMTAEDLHNLRALGNASVPWTTLCAQFTIWKNDALTVPTDYGTFDLNNDPRDNSANIEVAAMCMSGASATNFGAYPYTIAHAWMHAAIVARIAVLKNLDCLESFSASVEPSVLQNGPIFTISTHGERAIQTNDWPLGAASQTQSAKYGYFFGSGDPNLRWDLTLLDPAYIDTTKDPTADADWYATQCRASAAWIRGQAHAIKVAGFAPDDPLLILLSGGETPG